MQNPPQTTWSNYSNFYKERKQYTQQNVKIKYTCHILNVSGQKNPIKIQSLIRLLTKILKVKKKGRKYST